MDEKANGSAQPNGRGIGPTRVMSVELDGEKLTLRWNMVAVAIYQLLGGFTADVADNAGRLLYAAAEGDAAYHGGERPTHEDMERGVRRIAARLPATIEGVSATMAVIHELTGTEPGASVNVDESGKAGSTFGAATKSPPSTLESAPTNSGTS